MCNAHRFFFQCTHLVSIEQNIVSLSAPASACRGSTFSRLAMMRFVNSMRRHYIGNTQMVSTKAELMYIASHTMHHE